MTSRKVTIKRAPIVSTLPDSILDESVRKIGSSLTRSGSVLKGIDFAEEQKLLPAVIGVPSDHVEFLSKVNNWYSNMNIPVPHNIGITLETGTTEDGIPLNVLDYLKYKYAIAHPEVASSKQEAASNMNYRYYVEDLSYEIMETNKKVGLKKQAYKEFIKLTENEEKLVAVLFAMAPKMGQSVSTVAKISTKEEKENLLSDYIEKDASLFINLCGDADLEMRAEIEAMVDSGVLIKAGNRIIFGSEPLGETVEEAISYLKSASHSETYTILKAKHDQVGFSVPKPKVKKEK